MTAWLKDVQVEDALIQVMTTHLGRFVKWGGPIGFRGLSVVEVGNVRKM